ncbi:peptidoglycan editing factor PgeF [Clostridium vincentii]|uniref:Purine nucleoside phosphorylase n=1 Tax=Clostridium vincentii TaxID=52704 RepID=A0A2T0BJQ4_9CLOT|nr:peptidoglycan editing factor PgeF [Clostridium vincentii]PRR84120.1 Laccase domain protein [Clostridium vincentii]
MIKLKANSLNRYKDYLVMDNNEIKVVFSTAEEEKNFNRNTDEGCKELNNLKREFNVDNVVYLKQIHSDKVVVFNGEKENEVIETEGDALITNVGNSIIGVFTADCVPIILVDRNKGVIAAIHSGWKGTYKSITKKTIDKLIKEYKVDHKDIKAYIGPHIRKCCYEVSEELKNNFIKEKNISEDKLFLGRNLNMEECILNDLREHGVIEENINSVQLCTHCSKEIKLHSYRSSKGAYGRLFSFAILK